MTPEEKVAMLKKAGVWDVIGFPSCIDKLFDLVAAHEREQEMKAAEKAIYVAIGLEREACAKVCDEEAVFSGSNGCKDASALNCAAFIRARSEK